jgi:hypothetical protein
MSDSLKTTLKGGLPLILFVVGLLLLVYFIVVPAKKESNESTPAIEVSAEQLSAVYSSNENTAAETYGNKRLRITGAVIETGSEGVGQPYVLLQGAGSGRPDVQCIFPSSDIAPIVQSMKKGENTTLLGQCEGGQFKVILRDCRIP